LGTGLVLIPWAIIAAILRMYPLAIGVAMLYIIMLVVRNVVEPKLVGQQMGLHPVATLISMFLGLNLFGILGLFGFPIALSLYFKMSRTRKESMQKAAQ
ncbi:MAG: AI-2E family transporter, partial [Clostridia bacterium]|nr:AI-2E family transporter [Clostridia bacterium]